jgi:hypothetical protein
VHKIILFGALAGLTFFNVVVPEKQTITIETNVPQRPLKGDRLPAGPACLPSDIGSCVRKQTPAADDPPQAHEVRIALLDRSLAAPAAVVGHCTCSH